MIGAVIAFACGAVFAVGLVISGMTDPAKVLGFLDVTGAFDPSLAFVMVGAIGVFLPIHRVSRGRSAPLFGAEFAGPATSAIDGRLVAGAALFGLGWGASGYCPGPALASLGRGGIGALAFVAAMIAGMGLVRLAGGRAST